MKNPKRYLRIASVLIIAGATGHIMQYGDAIAARLGLTDGATAAPAAQEGPATKVSVLSTPRAGDDRALSFVPGAAEVRPDRVAPRRLSDPTTRVAALETRSDASPAPTHVAAPTDACAPALAATSAPAAMVELSLTAPCHPGTRVSVHHSMINFVASTDHEGKFSVVIPALDVLAHFVVTLEGLEPVATALEIPTLTDFERIAVAWAGTAEIELHAFEFGAAYGEDGHVWHGAPREPGHALSGTGGFSVRLGNPDDPAPAMAEVYTFPAAASTADGTVRLTLEAEVTGRTCAQDIAGRALQVGDPQPVQVTLSMPGCEATGDFLVLNNLFRDLKIAAR